MDHAKSVTIPKNKEDKQTLRGVVRISPLAELYARRWQAETDQPLSRVISACIVQVYEKGLLKITG